MMRMYKITNYDANGKLICCGCFPAQSGASAKQLYSLNEYVECIVEHLDWWDICIEYYNNGYILYNRNNINEYEKYNLDRDRDAYCELLDYDQFGNEISPSSDVVNWLCTSI